MYNTKNRYEQGQALRKEIYMYIVSYIKLVGYAPSITEISERVDAGRATVWKHINQLIDDDLLRTVQAIQKRKAVSRGNRDFAFFHGRYISTQKQFSQM